VFRKGSSIPALIAKTTFSYRFVDSIYQEAKNMRYIWENSSDALKTTIPRPLALEKIRGFPVYFEAAVPGIALPKKVFSCWFSRSKKKVICLTIQEIVNWTDDFIVSFYPKKTTWDSDFIDDYLLRPMREFRTRFELDSQELEYLSELERTAHRFDGQEIPLVPRHGDLWGGSIILGLDKQLKVIDWEFFERYGLPTQDFLYFAIHPGFVVGKRSVYGIFHEFMNLFQDSFYTEIIREGLYKKAATFCLDTRDFLEFMISFLLINLSLERDNKNSLKISDSWISLFRFFLRHKESCKILK
jgi:hypothetical protein